MVGAFGGKSPNQITDWLSFAPIHQQVLVQTPTTNYTVQDYQRLYSDIGFEDGWLMRQDTEPLVTDLTPPGVAIHCLYGSGIDTSEAFQYTEKFPDVEPTVVYGDGDGTVNLMSAVQCKRWIGKQKQPVTLMELPGNEHVNMLLNFTTVAYIKNVLFSPWCRKMALIKHTYTHWFIWFTLTASWRTDRDWLSSLVSPDTDCQILPCTCHIAEEIVLKGFSTIWRVKI